MHDIRLDFDGGLPIFKVIAFANGFRRKLASLAHCDEALAQARCQRRTKKESAGFQTYDDIEFIGSDRQRGFECVK